MGTRSARPVSVYVVVCDVREGDVVRGVKGGVCGRWGDDVFGMVYSVGVWTCGGVWVHVVLCGHVWVDVHVMCGRCRDAV